MLTQSLSELYDREIQSVIKELKAYRNPQQIWVKEKLVNNTAGNLALHLAGNLRHFFGAVISKDGYQRNREAEFSRNNVALEEMIADLSKASEVVKKALASLSAEELEAIYPLKIQDKEMTTEFFILHLLAHLSYHLGQISYHRRLLDTVA